MDRTLSVAIVTYDPDIAVLDETLSSLAAAFSWARLAGRLTRMEVCLVDNGPGPYFRERLEHSCEQAFSTLECVLTTVTTPGENLGFGRGNNLALQRATGDYYLVLNPDVHIEENALEEAVCFMEEHREIGLLSPRCEHASGGRQYLCKRYPAVIDLFLRGVMPAAVNALFSGRLGRYEMRGTTEDEPVLDVSIASGCFLFCRRSVLTELGGFSSEYFMYFEDFDLSLRAQRIAGIAYVPAVRILHGGGKTAGKGARHVRMFLSSAWTFYRNHGWRFI